VSRATKVSNWWLWPTAVHEAGHAVASLALGLAVEWVEVVSEYRGRCQFTSSVRDYEDRQAAARADAVVAYAGPAAQRLAGS
jgi:hypothetical protein